MSGEEMSAHLFEVPRTDWTVEQLTDAVMGRKVVYEAASRFFGGYDLLLGRCSPQARGRRAD